MRITGILSYRLPHRTGAAASITVRKQKYGRGILCSHLPFSMLDVTVLVRLEPVPLRLSRPAKPVPSSVDTGSRQTPEALGYDRWIVMSEGRPRNTVIPPSITKLRKLIRHQWCSDRHSGSLLHT